MKKYVYPSEISGTIAAPASKSVMQRAIAASLMADGESVLSHPSFCDDSQAAMRVAEGLGASVERKSDEVIIRGGINPASDTLNCGESGLCIRMFTPIAALTGKRMVLTGEGSLLGRPVSGIEDALGRLGVLVKSNNGLLPVEVSSILRGGSAEIDGSVSSQFLTGLLMALPAAEKDSVIKVNNLKSREYIDITVDVLKKFGIKVENRKYNEFRIHGGQKFTPAKIDIEGDWSGAAFLLCAGAVAGSVSVTGLNPESYQPDRAIITALRKSGAEVIADKTVIHIKSQNLHGFEFDATECPDLFPPLAALALYCKGESVIWGAGRLKHKESDRGTAIISEFKKMGGLVKIEKDCMIIRGSSLSGAVIDPHGDHRMAMACTVAAMGCSGAVEITNAECINKSYNEFYDHMIKLGAEIK
ncbi:MAG TPA: 3-phosphoshikimate 1-carboxyvinyltransferase [Spirochaetota bacterium]|nr:3-phosphoshikimate 1-carboxyvinyltransferase [Spirochaetota bacterium]HPS87209.1 3-phosphoshikimate 1-carboxyvinyltransferase [Spirochaetota bacterium]